MGLQIFTQRLEIETKSQDLQIYSDHLVNDDLDEEEDQQCDYNEIGPVAGRG